MIVYIRSCQNIGDCARPVAGSGFFSYSEPIKQTDLQMGGKQMKKMRIQKKLAVLGMAFVMALGMAACGGADSAKGVDKTYTVTYDNTMDAAVLETVPKYQFVAADLSYMISYGPNLDVTLKLDKDGTYTLTSKYYNQSTAAAPGTADYMDIHVEAKGTYTKEADKVTIAKAQSATAVYEGGAYITEQGMFTPFSYAADGATGTWTSADLAEILDCVPETIFTVTEGGAIVSWEAAGDAAGNPKAGADTAKDGGTDATADNAETGSTDAAAAGTAAGTEAEAGVTEGDFTMKASDTDAIFMTFHADGTCQFNFSDYSITEDCTWKFDGTALTVTNPNGKAAVSEMDGDTMKLTYVSAASDQLLGNLESTDWADFFK